MAQSFFSIIFYAAVHEFKFIFFLCFSVLKEEQKTTSGKRKLVWSFIRHAFKYRDFIQHSHWCSYYTLISPIKFYKLLFYCTRLCSLKHLGWKCSPNPYKDGDKVSLVQAWALLLLKFAAAEAPVLKRLNLHLQKPNLGMQNILGPR